MNTNERISYLLRQYLAEVISTAELQELKALLLQDQHNKDFQETLEKLIDQSPAVTGYETAAWEPLYEKIWEAGTAAGNDSPGRVVYLSKRRTWVAAAVFMLLAAGGGWLFIRDRSAKEIAGTQKAPSSSVNNDIAPGSNKATLTLADGSAIDLNTAGNGLLGHQGSSKVVKLNGGQLAYEEAASGKEASSYKLQTASGKEATSLTSYNTIATPKGGQYQLILPDGSKVWLNAASSLRYPTAFSGKERVVELKGEAYFEVAPLTAAGEHEKMPFRVHVVASPFNKEGMDVQVLGTHFNVMAYGDEQKINTTLLEGSVRLSKGDQSTLIRPGEQGTMNNGNDFTVRPVDIEDAIAWKNGLFRFKEAPIEEVMRQIARWYDVEVVYVNEAPKDLFQGEIYRNVNVSKVLKVLEASGVHFTVEGKKILVQS